MKIVHLAEFHGDGHPQDPGPVRLAELKAMFDECRRLSDDNLLVLAWRGGERPPQGDRAARIPDTGSICSRSPSTGPCDARLASPSSRISPIGPRLSCRQSRRHDSAIEGRTRPRVDGAPADQGVELDPGRLPRRRLLPRRSRWLGARWKAMPADLSSAGSAAAFSTCSTTWRTGAAQKYVPGEVDVFKIDHTHELYGHMNINYLRLDRDRVPFKTTGRRCSTPSAGQVLRDDRRGLAHRVHRRRPAERRDDPTPRRWPSDAPARPQLDVSAPLRRDRFRRRLESLSRADRLVGYASVFLEDVNASPRLARSNVGPRRSVGRRGRRRVLAAGLD